MNKHKIVPILFLTAILFQASVQAEIDTGPDVSVQTLVQKGLAALQSDKPTEALKFFRQAKMIDSRFAPAYVGEAEVLLIQNAWDESLALLDRAIELAPDFAVAYHNRGILQYYRGEYQAAYKDLHRAIKLGETVDPHILSQVWGAALPDEMIQKMNEQITANPEDGEAYLNRGIAFFYKKDFQSTLNDWKKSKELGVEPDHEMWKELERQIQIHKSMENVS